jgi:hypothetical protein
MNKSK